MKGQVVVITGATSGIGEVAARALAGMGARIVLVARDKERAEAVLGHLRGINAAASHSVHSGDLSRLAEMKRVGAQIAAAEPRIDVLINNAGALFASRQVTEDHWERTFATNHMAYFVLTHMLRDRLTASRARIVNTASSAHKWGSILRRLAVGQEILAARSLWPIQALQHSLYPRVGVSLGAGGDHRQLPSSRFRRIPLR